MGRPSKYPEERRERAVRMVAEIAPQYGSQWASITAVAGKLGVGATETVRTWVRRAEVDAGKRPGVTTQEAEELKRLKRENAELRRANEILKAAAISSRGNSTPAIADPRVHRRAAGRGPRGRVDLPGPARAGPAGCRAHLPVLDVEDRRRSHRQRRGRGQPGPRAGLEDRRRGRAPDDARGPLRPSEDDRARAPHDPWCVPGQRGPGDEIP